MRKKHTRTALTAAAAAGLALAGLAGPAPGLAAPITVQVPCQVSALSGAITNAVDGDVLQLARNCTYVLSSALPQVRTVPLTIQGTNSTLARSLANGTPELSLLTVGRHGDLTVSKVNFTNGYASYAGGAIDAWAARSLSPGARSPATTPRTTAAPSTPSTA